MSFTQSLVVGLTLVGLVLLAVTRAETTQVQLQKACAQTCKTGVETFEYHGANDFKCVCVAPLGAAVE